MMCSYSFSKQTDFVLACCALTILFGCMHKRTPYLLV
ncbi:hypothetical protein LINPERPRIM_LOCUS385 [Linum perenne]